MGAVFDFFSPSTVKGSRKITTRAFIRVNSSTLYLNDYNDYESKIQEYKRELEKAIDQNPDGTNRKIYYQLKNIQQALGLTDEAVAVAYTSLGNDLQQQGYIEAEVISIFEEAIRIDCKVAAAYSALGTILYKQGNKKEAIKKLETARSLFIERGMVAEADKIKQLIEYLHKSNNFWSYISHFWSHITSLLISSPETSEPIDGNARQEEMNRRLWRLEKRHTFHEVASASATRTILILAVNPKTTLPLRLGEEVRDIDAGLLQRAKKREQFEIKQQWAVRVRDVYRALLDVKPQIVHFSGHGAGDEGLALEDETGQVRFVDAEALAGVFKLFASEVECVVLNACYSEVQAEAIVKHIPYVIGMNKAIGDKAAIEFAVGFYDALGAGKPVEFAYQLGCNAIRLAGIAEHLTPRLLKKGSTS
ncbi:CHAT domain-containing protein [Brasilonema sp. UFV-L1]|uniref:CHAT domain-containing protein n=1 Tax=Brasilonema sp. UFV-L1 TaxID=2234130 RepID=UPI002006DE9F|nr:CHAT domain-containing protein [Brasilonema sp. UFV-L1]